VPSRTTEIVHALYVKSSQLQTLLEHSEAAALPSHKKHIDDFRRAERLAATIPAAAKVPPSAQPPPTATPGSPSPGQFSFAGWASLYSDKIVTRMRNARRAKLPKLEVSPFGCQSVAIINMVLSAQKRRMSAITSNSGGVEEDSEERENARTNPRPKGELLHAYLMSAMVTDAAKFSQKATYNPNSGCGR
jgi:hypothetical protein